MALPVWQGTTTDQQGNIVAGAEVKVVNEATGLDAVLFSDRAGTVGITNPFFADSNGFAQFYTTPGEYRVTSTNTATTDTNTWRYTVLSGTAAIRNTGTASGEVPLNSDLGTAAYKDVNAAGDVWGADNIEYGSNANGEYWKYPDGLLICTYSNSLASQSITFSVDGTFIFDAPVATFPHAFIAAPEVASSGQVIGRVGWTEPSEQTTTTVFVRFITLVSMTEDIKYGYQAIGKWK